MSLVTIEMVNFRETTRAIVMEDRWTFEPAGRLVKLWRWMFDCLRKHGGLKNAIGEQTSVTRQLVDGTTLFQKITQARGVLIRLDSEPKRLLIGAEDWQELVGGMTINEHKRFRVDADFYDRRGPQFMGLTVEIIPWMRGILVMP